MNKRLLWKLCGTIAVGSVALFWAINVLSLLTEHEMSFIAKEHQETLISYGKHAEQLYLSNDMDALERWLTTIQEQEQTWAAVVSSHIEPLANSIIPSQYIERFSLGRSVEWKIHLYFKENPVMDITFESGNTHFLIRLPQRMRPGAYWKGADIILQVALPLGLLIILSIILYHHVMSPLKQLERATRKFSEGNFDVRVRSCLGARNDELTALADTFDRMAERTGKLIITQRQLIADLSHELRTPLARIELVIDSAERKNTAKEAISRIRKESIGMRKLVEDMLTLAWLENENPLLNEETLDLVDLIDSITEDAHFEFPHHNLTCQLPEHAEISQSNHRSIGQAIENIVRNALRFTPQGGQVKISLEAKDKHFYLTVQDEGPGVPEQHLSDIFTPFFRVNKSRNKTPEGFGLGLALTLRHIKAVGGSVTAKNLEGSGLEISILIPRGQM
ncbi:sensor histidine kinase [Alkalimarinus alittae]|uniref:histidine kinase n=1 Tax=Alkalimarinus alittae TaxID=2961619 RepID=A0ABY6N4P5_9ALTE|nr:sensor histidine kinase [Alkalimarinus alittae]UZE97066.1 sensor histidine kinase [Alkalimarinus alittae]